MDPRPAPRLSTTRSRHPRPLLDGDADDNSVHPAVIGRRVDLVADLGQVVVTCDGVEVARHRRCWARHQSVTDPVHAAAAGRLRSARRAQTRPGSTPASSTATWPTTTASSTSPRRTASGRVPDGWSARCEPSVAFSLVKAPVHC
ncbi:hypothetical protein ACFO4M_19345 [Pseudonocardia nematodicida]|uniref:Mu transposase domain-containing protein n=1 Tax=Pseudonocardia nematodicida TaxID=1206997 RepID=UPI00360B2A9E